MMYLFIGENQIKLVALSKTLLGQYNLSYFDRLHTTNLLEKGSVKNTDVLASAVKEGLTGAHPQEIKDSEVYLVLPQAAFTFARYEVPADIQTGAIIPFIRDKARADFSFDLDRANSDFLIIQQENESIVLVYVIQDNVLEKYKEALQLLGLSIKAVVPDTVSFYKLFEKTLKKDKKENIFYVSYQETNSWGYLYDSLGLVNDKIKFFGDDFKKDLKAEAEKQEKKGGKIDRIILSGEKSPSVRQDFFTKEIGVWTNPLDKIITNFYQDYLKLLISDGKNGFSTLKFDVCLGAFILHRENPEFSVYKSGRASSFKESGKTFSLPALPIGKKDVMIFLLSMVLTASAIYLFKNLKKIKSPIGLPKITKSAPTPTNKPEPTEKPSPIPSLSKESLKIKVLNGTGTVGQAGKVRDALKQKGYVEVLTGNADSYDNGETLIRVTKDKKDAATAIQNDLVEIVNIEKKDISTFENEEETADLIMITGEDLNK